MSWPQPRFWHFHACSEGKSQTYVFRLAEQFGVFHLDYSISPAWDWGTRRHPHHLARHHCVGGLHGDTDMAEHMIKMKLQRRMNHYWSNLQTISKFPQKNISQAEPAWLTALSQGSNKGKNMIKLQIKTFVDLVKECIKHMFACVLILFKMRGQH